MTVIKRVTGINGFSRYPRKASTALVKGTLAILKDGKLEPAKASATVDNLAGIILKGVDSTDPNYAVAEMTQVEEIFEAGNEYELEIGAGSFSADKVGKSYKLDANGKADLDNTGTAFEVVRDGGTPNGVATVIVRFRKN